MTTESQQLLLLPQRLKLAAQFTTDVNTAIFGSGVLLSGPNGVGKSGVGLLSYLLCAARRLPVVYLTQTAAWVETAKRGEGDSFFLSAFWKQNADLIAGSASLRQVFAAVMRDEDAVTSFTPYVMDALRDTMRRQRLGIGVIIDEVQHITAVVSNRITTLPSPLDNVAASYFRNNWHDWMNANRIFARMSIASAHGERDFKVPAGEGRRVHVVEPLTDDQRIALQSHPKSPAFVSDQAARDRIVFYSGNILRALVEAAHGLPSSPTMHEQRLAKLYVSMQEDCRHWLTSLADKQRATAAEQAMELLSAKLPWTAAKGLYDCGILYRTADSDLLRPVSAAASSAYLKVTAEYVARAAKPLSSYGDGRLRGYALEAQVLARLSNVSVEVDSKMLDGTLATRALSLRSSYVLPFDKLAEVVKRDAPVLYRSQTLTCATASSCLLQATWRAPLLLWSAAQRTRARGSAWTRYRSTCSPAVWLRCLSSASLPSGCMWRFSTTITWRRRSCHRSLLRSAAASALLRMPARRTAW